MKILIKRIYEPATRSDGFRVLVDRLWPRGISKESAKLDLWLPEIGPSTALRQWFNHDPERWKEFRRRYHVELRTKHKLVAELKVHAKKGTVTLLYSAKDKQHNQAVALQRFLLNRTASRKPASRGEKKIPTVASRKKIEAGGS